VLKPFHGTPPESTPPFPPLRNGRVLHRPARAVRGQLRRGVWHVLIQWDGLPDTEATWEPIEEFRALFPAFQLEDELFVEGGERCYDWESISPKEPWLSSGATMRLVPSHVRFSYQES